MTEGTPILGQIGIPTAVVPVEIWATFGPGAFVPMGVQPALWMGHLQRALVTVRLVAQV